MSDEPQWKKLKLPLERPYKDDKGEPIPVLLDIAPDGQHIYEPKEDPSKELGENLRRIFLERGVDLFDKLDDNLLLDEGSTGIHTQDSQDEITSNDALEDKHDASAGLMTPEDLFKMRMEILPQLHIALGEMSHARDLLTLLLASPSADRQPADPPEPSSILGSTIVTKPPRVASVQAFDSQLSISGKDESLRKAADLFKSSAESMERSRVAGEKYWVDALKIRRGNWGLIPAPLPFGTSTAKGVDKTSKDFLVSFGLEESPPAFRRRAIGHMANCETDSDSLVFPHRQQTRLRISTHTMDAARIRTSSQNVIKVGDTSNIEGSLRVAQQEVIEQEIFSVLVEESSRLPTASARVSERLIVIDAAEGVELRFELVDANAVESQETTDGSIICDLIYAVLHALLLRMHSQLRSLRLGRAGVPRSPGFLNVPRLALLQPIIDLLQYQSFCQRVQAEVDNMTGAIRTAGIPSTLRFTAVGESGKDLVKLLDEGSTLKIGGEATLRIDNKYTLRFTFLSPSSLTAHLPQATLTLSSIPQFCQLLSDEIERCLLNKICELGNDLCGRISGTWFVDFVTGRSVGRWEGCVINFRVFFGEKYAIHCSAFRLDRENEGHSTFLETYNSQNPLPLMSWVEQIIQHALLAP